MVHALERCRCHTVPMITGPATNDRVQQFNQRCLTHGFVHADESPDFLQEGVRILLRWLDQWLAIIFSEILSEEIESLIDMGDARLVGGE